MGKGLLRLRYGAPSARLFAAVSFFLAVLCNHRFDLGLVQLAASLILLRVACRNFDAIISSLKLLLWLLVPIIVLHALFSPGELLVAGMWPSVSREGVVLGLELGARLLLLYFSGMLLLYALDQREWLQQLICIPFFGIYLVEGLVLFVPLQNHIQSIFRTSISALKVSGIHGWRRVLIAPEVFARSLYQGRMLARQLWLRWGNGCFLTTHAQEPYGGWWIYGCWGVGWLTLVMIW